MVTFNKPTEQKEVKMETKTLKAPAKKYRIIDSDVEEYNPSINLLLMGVPGSGKTNLIADLVLSGAKIFSINTDPGQVGEETIWAKAVKTGKEEIFKKNFKGIGLTNFTDTIDFLEDPTKFYPKFYDFDPDFLVWEGFSTFQQNHVFEYVGEAHREAVENSPKDKNVVEVRAEGYRAETQDWGIIRNATMRGVERFLAIRNLKTGRVISKIMTVHEAVETQQIKVENSLPKTEERLSGRPFISGGAKNNIASGFSLSIRCVEEKGKYFYENTSKTLGFTKNRGIDLPDGKFAANPMELINLIEKSYKVSLFNRA